MGFSITYKSQVQGSLDQSTTSCCKRPPPFGPRTGASCHSGVTVALNIKQSLAIIALMLLAVGTAMAQK
jgi:hypothetical protein